MLKKLFKKIIWKNCLKKLFLKVFQKMFYFILYPFLFFILQNDRRQEEMRWWYGGKGKACGVSNQMLVPSGQILPPFLFKFLHPNGRLGSHSSYYLSPHAISFSRFSTTPLSSPLRHKLTITIFGFTFKIKINNTFSNFFCNIYIYIKNV